MTAVHWTPSNLPCTGYEDEASNEFTSHPNCPIDKISPDDFEAYFEWWHSPQAGTVVHFDPAGEVVDICLKTPLTLPSGIVLTHVRYPLEDYHDMTTAR